MTAASPEDYLSSVRVAFYRHLTDGLIPFWLDRSLDRDHGGYLTALDENGQRVAGQTDKFIVIQARMIWAFARLCRFLPQHNRAAALGEAARQGVDFLIAHLWDTDQGGWFWACTRDGRLRADDKVVYGQSFAIYALAEYTLATGDPRGLDYANRTFDLLQRHCADVARGGYYEDFTQDWLPKTGYHFGGDRKSMNTHMHLMEAFTTLVRASGQAVHTRRLQELVDLIITCLINPDSGAGHDWFALDFTPLPSGEVTVPYQDADGRLHGTRHPLDPPVFLNSYGHDIELAWLLVEAGRALGQPTTTYLDVAKGLADHTLAHGLDRTYGGLYFEGQHGGAALTRCKSWWQQAEALVGLLDLYELTHESDYLAAFRLVWDFANRHLIDHTLGEWCSLLAEDGQPIQPDLGHDWKAAYHTARAMVESLLRLDRILEEPV